MDLTCDVWQIVTNILAETLPECDVVRTYDTLQHLEELKGRNRPLVSVGLDGRDSEIVHRSQVQETFHFAAVIQKYLEAQGEEAKRSEMDAVLPLVTRIQDRFCQQTWEGSGPFHTGQTLKLKLISGESASGEFYDIGYYVTSELFIGVCSINVKMFRNLGE